MKDRPVDPDELEALVLQRARAGMAPSPSRRHQALAGIAVGLSIPPPALPGGLETLGSAGSAPGGASLAGAGTSVATQLSSGAVQAGMALKTGFIAFVLATGAGVGAYTAVTGMAPPVTSHAPVMVAAPAESGRVPTVGAPPASAGLARRTEAGDPSRPAQESLRAGPLSGAGAVPTAPTGRHRVATASPSHEAAPPKEQMEDRVRDNPMARELAGLRNAQAALARGDGAAALQFMQRLDETDPGGPLSAERAVTRVLALCQLGRTTAATAVARRALQDGRGTALYRHRLATSCAEIDDTE